MENPQYLNFQPRHWGLHIFSESTTIDHRSLATISLLNVVSGPGVISGPHADLPPALDWGCSERQRALDCHRWGYT